MRIISGKYRGKKINTPADANFRPTLDRVKQSLYDVIQFLVQDSNVLDMFAGSGALGIEALSRGAKKVVFNDNSKKSLDIVRQNLIDIKGDYQIINHDFNDLAYKVNQSFDIIFADPPYNMPDSAQSIETAIKLSANNSVIIYERLGEKISADEFLCDKAEFLSKVDNIVTKHYGTVAVDFIYIKESF